MTRVRILLMDMPRMLREVVREVIARDPRLTIVGELPERGERLLDALPYDPEVVVTGSAGLSDDAVDELLTARPRVRVLAIGADGGRTVVYRLRPERMLLGELSPAALREELLG